jgi:hypothetical protein
MMMSILYNLFTFRNGLCIHNVQHNREARLFFSWQMIRGISGAPTDGKNSAWMKIHDQEVLLSGEETCKENISIETSDIHNCV